MKNRDLKDWIVVLTILPVLLTGLALTSYFTVNRFAELDSTLLRQGNALVEPLAIAVESAMTAHNKRQLRRLVYATHRNHAKLVNNIAVYNLQREPILFSGNKKALAQLTLPDDSPYPDPHPASEN